jgi:hypothetical protein
MDFGAVLVLLTQLLVVYNCSGKLTDDGDADQDMEDVRDAKRAATLSSQLEAYLSHVRVGSRSLTGQAWRAHLLFFNASAPSPRPYGGTVTVPVYARL